jgi:hypothetical protein
MSTRCRESDGLSYCIRYTGALPDGYWAPVIRVTQSPRLQSIAQLVPALATAATLREKAISLGVSPETVRNQMHKYGLGTDAASRNAERDARIREMAMRGVAWPMTAVALLADLRARGVEFVADGDKVRYRLAGSVTAASRAALVEYKPEVRRLLIAEAALPRPVLPHGQPLGTPPMATTSRTSSFKR